MPRLRAISIAKPATFRRSENSDFPRAHSSAGSISSTGADRGRGGSGQHADAATSQQHHRHGSALADRAADRAGGNKFADAFGNVSHLFSPVSSGAAAYQFFVASSSTAFITVR
jgi:hypothetical protein